MNHLIWKKREGEEGTFFDGAGMMERSIIGKNGSQEGGGDLVCRETEWSILKKKRFIVPIVMKQILETLINRGEN